MQSGVFGGDGGSFGEALPLVGGCGADESGPRLEKNAQGREQLMLH